MHEFLNQPLQKIHRAFDKISLFLKLFYIERGQKPFTNRSVELQLDSPNVQSTK